MFATLRAEPTLYLVDEFDEDRSLKENLGAFWLDIFETSLEGWSLLESQWPSPRTYELFEQWFDTEVFEDVEDLAG